MRTSRRSAHPAALTALATFAVVATSAVPSPAWAQAGEGRADRSGHLIALSDPPGAYVYVDGLLLGQTPLRSVALTPGEYRIWFRSRPPLTFEPEPLPERTFSIVAGDSILVHEAMGSLVRVESTPPGAVVTVDGRIEGRAPIEFRWRPRDEDVRVTLDGHRPRRIDDAALGAGGTIRVRLAPDPGAADAADVAGVTGGRPRAVNWPAWGSLAAGAAAAGLAIYFKSEADDAYDAYLASAVPDEMDRHLDESNRFDHLSSLSWVAAEGGLVLALWFFAKDVLAVDHLPRPLVRAGEDGPALGFEVAY